ncbi:MAG: nuclear transport factor 2 family protein [Solirubrobacteraceae bacterium]
MRTINDLDDFKGLEPFFRIIERGLDGLADGEHFFDLLAEEVVFDYIISTPGYPRHVEGRQAVAELYRHYSDVIVLDRCDDLAVHHDPNTGVVVLEYASHGRVVSTGTPYANRYVSVLTIAGRKVSRWRDYLDPVAVFKRRWLAFALERPFVRREGDRAGWLAEGFAAWAAGVGQPWDGWLLLDSGLVPVADPGWEGPRELGPLLVGECDCELGAP